MEQNGLSACIMTLTGALCLSASAAVEPVNSAGDVPAPYGLAAEDVTTNSFKATWSMDVPVESFLFDCWNVSSTSWTGCKIWEETFSTSVNTGGNPVNLTETTFDQHTDCAGWSGDFVYAPARTNGIIQVGKSSRCAALLVSPGLQTAEHAELVVRARAIDAYVSHPMPVFLIRNGETNEVATFELKTSFDDFHCTIGSVSTGDRLAFRPYKNDSDRRVQIDSVSLVDGFSLGHAVTNAICESAIVEHSPNPSFKVENLDAGKEYQFAVRAVVNDTPSAPSEVCFVMTKSANDILDAVAISELPRNDGINVWREDFCSFTNVFPSASKNSAAWMNGTTLPHWQAYCGGAAVTNITRNYGGKTSNGLYAYWSVEELPSTYSLGTMTAGDAKEFAYGLAFRNDTEFSIRKISVGFDGMQFGFRNTAVQSLVFEYLVTNELVSVATAGPWVGCPDLAYRTTKDYSSGLTNGYPVATALSSDIFGATVPKDCYFMMRWRRAATTFAAAMAIDNVAVSFTVQSRPLVIVVR